MTSFFCFYKHDVEEATSMEATAKARLNLRHRAAEREIPFYHGFSLTNATQVRLFNAAGVRSEAFSQDE